MKKLRVLLLAVIMLAVFALGFPVPTAYADSGNVYVGGYQIGISVDIDGLLVESVTGVETEYGLAAVDGLYKGDIIKKINGVGVDSYDDVANALTAEKTEIELIRGGSTVTVEVVPVTEAYSDKPRLGITLKDKIYGVGTVTFVREDGSFVALGHEIYDSESNVHVPFAGGNIHSCKVLGVKRGTRHEAGALIATLVPDKIIGTVECNNGFGVAGKYTGKYDKSYSLPLGSRADVKPGAAVIRTSIGGKPEEYAIEIIKASKQPDRKEKGIVFRVTDKRLLDSTGGIVRGMSGSPIIQDGKVVAAVTHVLLNDYTKGYGLYADFLN